MCENINYTLGYTQFNEHEKDPTVHAQHKAEAHVICRLNPCFLLCLAYLSVFVSSFLGKNELVDINNYVELFRL